VPMLAEFAAGMGFGQRVLVRAVAATGEAMARDPDGAIAALAAEARAAVAEDGAEAVVVGGAGLAGLADSLASTVPVPVLDSLACGVRFALALAARGARPRPAHPAGEPSAVSGIGGALAALLCGGRQTRAERS